MKSLASWFGAIAAILVPGCCNAMVAPEPLSNLVNQADEVVVARVVRVVPFPSRPTHSTIRVRESWKGTMTNSIAVSVKKRSSCDVSFAVLGEAAVFLLQKDTSARQFWIMKDGRGRMPIRVFNGKQYAELWPEIVLPASLDVLRELPQSSSEYCYVSLDSLREYVQGMSRMNSQPAPNQAVLPIAASAAQADR